VARRQARPGPATISYLSTSSPRRPPAGCQLVAARASASLFWAAPPPPEDFRPLQCTQRMTAARGWSVRRGIRSKRRSIASGRGLGRDQQAAVGGDDVDRYEIVAGQAVLAAEQPDAPPRSGRRYRWGRRCGRRGRPRPGSRDRASAGSGPPQRGRRRTGSTRQPFMAPRSIMSPVAHRLAGHVWPPPRTEISSAFARAKLMQATTSAAVAQRRSGQGACRSWR